MYEAKKCVLCSGCIPLCKTFEHIIYCPKCIGAKNIANRLFNKKYSFYSSLIREQGIKWNPDFHQKIKIASICDLSAEGIPFEIISLVVNETKDDISEMWKRHHALVFQLQFQHKSFEKYLQNQI